VLFGQIDLLAVERVFDGEDLQTRAFRAVNGLGPPQGKARSTPSGIGRVGR
jgi:hypothetical protein